MHLSPTYALAFILENGWASLIVMSAVILCVTGGEALYADMGHLGREPIVKGWVVVFPALVLSYLGQGAYVIMTEQYPQRPLLDDQSHQPDRLCPLPHPEYRCNGHRIAGNDLRHVLDRLPGYDYPPPPEDEDRIYLARTAVPDLYRCRQLDAARCSTGRHVRVPLHRRTLHQRMVSPFRVR